MKKFFAIAFISILIFPMLLWVAGINISESRINEKRKLATFPCTLGDFSFRSVERAVEDNLPLRTNFIAGYEQLWEKALGTHVNSYFKGNNGHFFPEFKNAPTLTAYMGLTPIPKRMIQRMAVVLAGKQAFWESHGIQYCAAFLPDKTTLYSEYLPEWMPQGLGYHDQILELFEIKDLNFIDFTPILEKHKDKPLYNKGYDILHWNGYALDVAYNFIVERYNLTSVKNNFKIEVCERWSPMTVEDVPKIRMDNSHISIAKNIYGRDSASMTYKPVKTVNDSASSGTFLLLSDSYFKNNSHQNSISKGVPPVFPIANIVHTYIGMHFVTPLDVLLKVIKNDKPDKVFEAFVERGTPGVAFREYDPRLLIAGELLLNNAYSSPTLQKPNDQGNSSFKVNARNTQKGGQSESALHLPSRKADSTGRLVFIAKIESPHQTKLEIFYSRQGEAFKKVPSGTVAIKPGINYIHMPIYTFPDAEVELRLKFPEGDTSYNILNLPEIKDMFHEEIANAI